MSSAIGLRICAVTTGIKKYKPIIKKKKKKHDDMVLLAKFKLNSIDVLISKSLIDSFNSHDGFVLINNVLKEYDNVKEEIKKSIKDDLDLRIMLVELLQTAKKESKNLKKQEIQDTLIKRN